MMPEPRPHRLRRRPTLWVAPALALVVLTGCGSVHTREDAAAAAATAFHKAVAAGDTGQACELLTESARSALAHNGDCAAALADTDIPEAGSVERSAVWGKAAQVVLNGDTVFLTTFDGSWLVRAAGCEPDPPRPYDCAVEG